MGKDYLGKDQRRVTDDKKEDETITALDAGDIAVLKTYGTGPYTNAIKKTEKDIDNVMKRVIELTGIKESDTGLAHPGLWDLAADKQMMQEQPPLQVARCTKIIPGETEEQNKYMINIKQIAKFVVGLHDKVAPTDIEEGMRIGVDRSRYQIHIPLPPKIDASVTMMQVEDKPDVTYADGRTHILKIHTKSMSVERGIRYELLARLCPNSTGAELRSVCTEAGMFAIRARRKVATEKDFLDAINKVVKGFAKFSSTGRYMAYN
ncbi:26S protease regulatory subunit 7 [Salpingoeca rosetta]|uniref:26S protease regulatory subunit 7 n=1 Tax=Salpingoeca rosetta (strain ATCC 50818 / BSB-021) TaxID=946362 RepID=F2TYX2_SALR5|nr:26S protease regulatory subunit 7 [Salpingoeca rosetta]EGD78796.1 26S protease regulatory subunit 7 [Salpingoeca rosetta]|eukprot:XP_004997752.1 26S protease regulatory subunit 7 [Salpingoeca rosetta]